MPLLIIGVRKYGTNAIGRRLLGVDIVWRYIIICASSAKKNRYTSGALRSAMCCADSMSRVFMLFGYILAWYADECASNWNWSQYNIVNTARLCLVGRYSRTAVNLIYKLSYWFNKNKSQEIYIVVLKSVEQILYLVTDTFTRYFLTFFQSSQMQNEL